MTATRVGGGGKPLAFKAAAIARAALWAVDATLVSGETAEGAGGNVDGGGTGQEGKGLGGAAIIGEGAEQGGHIQLVGGCGETAAVRMFPTTLPPPSVSTVPPRSPPPACAVLPATTERVSVNVLALRIAPPVAVAELPLKVLLVTVSAAPLAIAPPAPVAVLLLKVLFDTVTAPPLL